MIEIQDLTVRIGATEILKDLNLTIAANNWTCFVGPNGAGKTTLLKSILGSQSYAGLRMTALKYLTITIGMWPSFHSTHKFRLE